MKHHALEDQPDAPGVYGSLLKLCVPRRALPKTIKPTISGTASTMSNRIIRHYTYSEPIHHSFNVAQLIFLYSMIIKGEDLPDSGDAAKVQILLKAIISRCNSDTPCTSVATLMVIISHMHPKLTKSKIIG